MKHRTLAGAALSALLLAGTVGVVAHGVAPATASSRLDPKAQKAAAKNAGKATKALSSKKWDKAVRFAEEAVAIDGNDAGYRQLLGNAYLRAGRFQSAAQTFADVLVLQPENGSAALNGALAQIALGKWAEARTLLDTHETTIPAADRGLALALAGDPTRAVDVLTTATRTPQADAKTRQNLALALALAGRWQESRVLIGLDMTPVEADQRIVQWATFAQPTQAYDQVASLLGVKPASDPGQPVAIALNGTTSVSQPQSAAIDTFMPGQPSMADDTPVQEVAAVPAPAPTITPTPATSQTMVERYAAAQEVRVPMADAAPVETPMLMAAGGDYKRRAAAKPSIKRETFAAAAAKGKWYVQLGAFDNAAVARDGWARALRRLPDIGGYQPAGMTASVKGNQYYRLSVGGFARADAMALCRSYRVKGGTCFVRAQAGDQLAAWHKRGVEMASR